MSWKVRQEWTGRRGGARPENEKPKTRERVRKGFEEERRQDGELSGRTLVVTESGGEGGSTVKSWRGRKWGSVEGRTRSRGDGERE